MEKAIHKAIFNISNDYLTRTYLFTLKTIEHGIHKNGEAIYNHFNNANKID